MEINEIKDVALELMDALASKKLGEVAIELEGVKIKIKAAAPAPVIAAAPSAAAAAAASAAPAAAAAAETETAPAVLSVAYGYIIVTCVHLVNTFLLPMVTFLLIFVSYRVMLYAKQRR